MAGSLSLTDEGARTSLRTIGASVTLSDAATLDAVRTSTIGASLTLLTAGATLVLGDKP